MQGGQSLCGAAGNDFLINPRECPAGLRTARIDAKTQYRRCVGGRRWHGCVVVDRGHASEQRLTFVFLLEG